MFWFFFYEFFFHPSFRFSSLCLITTDRSRELMDLDIILSVNGNVIERLAKEEKSTLPLNIVKRLLITAEGDVKLVILRCLLLSFCNALYLLPLSCHIYCVSYFSPFPFCISYIERIGARTRSLQRVEATRGKIKWCVLSTFSCLFPTN